MELAMALIVGAIAVVWWFALPLTFLQRDPLAVTGVGSAALAFMVWAWPHCGLLPFGYFCEPPFSPGRLPAVTVFFGLAVISLLLRRR
jgi:hypothetical protein